MKNKAVSIVILTLICLLASCTKAGQTASRLIEVDSLLYQNPDSAYQILEGMKKDVTKMPEDLQAYYNLLQVKATGRTVRKHLSDSVILQVVDYCEQHLEFQHLGEAYFYAGRVCTEVDKNVNRVLYYMELALLSDTAWLNDFWRSRIFAQKGYMYQKNGLFQEASDMHVIARTYCQQIGDTMGVRICTEDLASIEEMQQMVPEDSASLANTRQSIKGIYEKARLKSLKLENDRLQSSKEKKDLNVTIIVVPILGGILVYLLWRRKRKKKSADANLDTPSQGEPSTTKPTRRNFYDAEVDAILQERIKADKALKQTDWQLVESRLLATFPTFRSSLFAHYELSETEYRICMLIKMNVSPSNMARLLAMGNSSISQARLRMQQKVFDGNGTAKDWDNYIQSLS